MSEAAAAWYYKHQGSSKGPFTPEQIDVLIRADVVNEHTSVWSEYLGDWRPLFRTDLRSLLGDRLIQPPTDTTAAEPVNSDEEALARLFEKRGNNVAAPGSSAPTFSNALGIPSSKPPYDNMLLGQVLSWFMCINGGISAIQVLLIFKAEGGTEGKYQRALLFETPEVATLIAIPFLINIVLFLWWKYRSTVNLQAARGPQSVSPAGAIYWYFVPIAWFWKPYEAMKNLVIGFNSGPLSTAQKWWSLFLASILVPLAAIANLPDQVSTLSEAQAYVVWSVAIYGVEVVWCFVAADLIKSITSAQSKLLAHS